MDKATKTKIARMAKKVAAKLERAMIREAKSAVKGYLKEGYSLRSALGNAKLDGCFEPTSWG